MVQIQKSIGSDGKSAVHLVGRYGNLLVQNKNFKQSLTTCKISRENSHSLNLNNDIEINFPKTGKVSEYRRDFLMLNIDFWDRIESIEALNKGTNPNI
jgi:hypothetical protein